MLHGLEIVQEMRSGLEKFLTDKKFERLADVVGKSLPFFSTHGDLVQRQKAAKIAKAGESSRDNEWAEKKITDKTTELTAN
jgi:hypothetical protein